MKVLPVIDAEPVVGIYAGVGVDDDCGAVAAGADGKLRVGAITGPSVKEIEACDRGRGRQDADNVGTFTAVGEKSLDGVWEIPGAVGIGAQFQSRAKFRLVIGNAHDCT